MKTSFETTNMTATATSARLNSSQAIRAAGSDCETRLLKDVEHRPILALAPNGAYKQKSDHPRLPLSLKEITRTAVDACRAGATLLHLHIRDKQNRHSLDSETYRRAIDAIQDRLGDKIIVQITSEAANRFTPAEQIASVRAVNPESVSIALREIIPEQSFIAAAQDLFYWCAARQCRIQFILYSEQDLQAYLNYQNEGIIPAAPHSLLFVLGRYSQNQASSPADLDPFLRHTDALDMPWMACAFGAAEQSCLIAAAEKGGHMRTGFENNLLAVDGRVAPDNASQLRDIRNRISIGGRDLASVQQAREILQIR